jgi:hypothetical protein
MRNKIEFPANVPVPIRMDWDEGAPKEKNGVTDYMYICNSDADIFFAKEPLHDAIKASGARAGTEIWVTKHEIPKGRTKEITWEVQLVDEEPSQRFGGNTHSYNREHSNAIDQQHAANRTPQPPPQAAPKKWPTHTPAQQQVINRKLQDGYTPETQETVEWNEPQVQVRAQTTQLVQDLTPTPASVTAGLDGMLAAHKAACDIAAVAELYAKGLGLNIHYTSEDIRAMAATLFINQCQGGKR